jgi:hypothetical protein
MKYVVEFPIITRLGSVRENGLVINYET